MSENLSDQERAVIRLCQNIQFVLRAAFDVRAKSYANEELALAELAKIAEIDGKKLEARLFGPASNLSTLDSRHIAEIAYALDIHLEFRASDAKPAPPSEAKDQ